jgi:hypothetical protein
MVIGSTGNIGIGVTTPGAPLHVGNVTMGSSLTGNGIFMGMDGSGYAQIQMNSSIGSYIDFSTSGVDYKGRIIYTNADNTMDFMTDAVTRARISATGDLTMTGDITAFGSISDRRFKENIQDISEDISLAKIKALRPVTFTWNDTVAYEQKRGTTDAGFIAQEVAEVVEYAVDEFQDIASGEMYKKLKHERIIPYLVGAIKQLERRISELEKQ